MLPLNVVVEVVLMVVKFSIRLLAVRSAIQIHRLEITVPVDWALNTNN